MIGKPTPNEAVDHASDRGKASEITGLGRYGRDGRVFTEYRQTLIYAHCAGAYNPHSPPSLYQYLYLLKTRPNRPQARKAEARPRFFVVDLPAKHPTMVGSNPTTNAMALIADLRDKLCCAPDLTREDHLTPWRTRPSWHLGGQRSLGICVIALLRSAQHGSDGDRSEVFPTPQAEADTTQKSAQLARHSQFGENPLSFCEARSEGQRAPAFEPKRPPEPRKRPTPLSLGTAKRRS
jgi:hypothetical protein